MAQTTPKKQPNRGITSKVREHFETKPGTVIFLKDLTEQFRITEVLGMQVMSNLVRMDSGYQVHIRARAWIYRPAVERATPLMFEQVGVLKDGDLLLQATDGTVYRAAEL